MLREGALTRLPRSVHVARREERARQVIQHLCSQWVLVPKHSLQDRDSAYEHGFRTRSVTRRQQHTADMRQGLGDRGVLGTEGSLPEPQGPLHKGPRAAQIAFCDEDDTQVDQCRGETIRRDGVVWMLCAKGPL
jgi:hypothetical protein